ncbi:MAG: hypothetical protein ABI127_07590, partial [Dokdonella sp.]
LKLRRCPVSMFSTTTEVPSATGAVPKMVPVTFDWPYAAEAKRLLLLVHIIPKWLDVSGIHIITTETIPIRS